MAADRERRARAPARRLRRRHGSDDPRARSTVRAVATDQSFAASIICPNHGFAIARLTGQISRAFLRIEQVRREPAQDQQRQPALQRFTLGAPVDYRHVGGYLRRHVIAAASTGDAAAVRPRSLYGSIPVRVRTVLVRKLLAGRDGKVVSRVPLRAARFGGTAAHQPCAWL